jgi:5-hydroxyisourate hydrolase-like protein (transthyretin family)
MSRFFQLSTLVLALAALALFTSRSVKADDAATSQPSSGSITVTVNGADGNPAAKVAVMLFPAAKTDDADAKPKKAKALARGRTDSDGKFTFQNVANGDYTINASIKKTGAKGTTTATVSDSASAANVTISLEGGATTAPANN